jgi:hypothetical protein
MAPRIVTRRPRRVLLTPVALVVLLVLTSCGSGAKPASPTATAESAASPTLAPGEVSVSSLLDRIDLAWPGVTSMRATSWTGQYDDPVQAVAGTPPADQMVTVEQVVKPSSRSISTTIGGAAVDDQVAVDGIVYFRGQSVTSAIAPFLSATAWVRVDPTMVPADSPVGQQLAYLTAPLGPPYGAVSDDLRARGATLTGQVSVGDRTCDVYAFTDAAPGDTGIAYSLSLDSTGLPCSLTQSAGGYANVTIWTFNDPAIVVTPPSNAVTTSGTPVSQAP